MTNVVLILTTVPDADLGDRIARTLVSEHLAACVNVHGAMTSVYRWRGQVERETEHQVVIKTTAERVEAVRARIAELHSYELPELLVLPVAAGEAEYIAWIETGTNDD